MSNDNYELYRRNKVDIFNMFYETWERAPILPIFPTEEEIKQHEKEVEEFAKQEKPKIYEKLKDMGFKMNPIK